MACVEDGRVYQVGTFNGNPLTMAAARASLFEVLTPDGYAHLHRLNERILAGCTRVRRGVPPARLRGRDRREGLRHVLAGAGRRLRDVQGAPGRRADRARRGSGT